ncbi:hypothetical protein AB0H76_39090 [Nocardia sp. NPDC050712]|uniref:hypothetical protein n=1 Tax=Actinomycetes TaxID=1760 RepID=UPI0033FE9E01
MTRPTGARRPKDNRREELAKIVSTGGRGTSATSTSDRRRRTPKAGAPNDDDRPALQRRGDTKQQQGINFDLALLQYMRDAVAYMQRRHPEEAGVESLAALLDQAAREKLAVWEKKYNGGKALPPL